VPIIKNPNKKNVKNTLVNLLCIILVFSFFLVFYLKSKGNDKYTKKITLYNYENE